MSLNKHEAVHLLLQLADAVQSGSERSRALSVINQLTSKLSKEPKRKKGNQATVAQPANQQTPVQAAFEPIIRQHQQDQAVPEHTEDDRDEEHQEDTAALIARIQEITSQYNLSDSDSEEDEPSDEFGPIRQEIFQAVLRRGIQRVERCHRCASDNSAVVQCTTCNRAGILLCHECDREVHRFANVCVHSRTSIKEVPQQALRPTQFYAASSEEALVLTDFPVYFDIKPSCVCCENRVLEENPSQFKELILICREGRSDIHIAGYKCSSCKATVYQSRQDLIPLGLIPAAADESKNKTYCDQGVLLELAKRKRHNPGGGVIGFVKELDARSLNHNNDRKIDNKAFTKAYRQYMVVYDFHLNLVKGIRRHECPPCSIHQTHGATDGLMKLLVNHRPSFKDLPPYYINKEGAIFLDDKLVAGFKELADHVSRGIEDEQGRVCGAGFKKAGDGGSGKFAGLAITGRLFTGCSHMFVHMGLNMQAGGGEKYVYIFIVMCLYFIQRGIDYAFGDLMCKWRPWAEKLVQKLGAAPQELINQYSDVSEKILLMAGLQKEQLQSFKAVVAGVHAKLHAWYCQVLNGPVWCEGIGTDVGEYMELIYAFLHRLGNSTKHMSKGRSTDEITEMALAWNHDKLLKLAPYLVTRFKAALEKKEAARSRYAEVKRDLVARHSAQGRELNMTEDLEKQMKRDVLAAAEVARQRSRSRLSPAAEFFKYSILIKQLKVIDSIRLSVKQVDRLIADVDVAEMESQLSKMLARIPQLRSKLDKLMETLQPFSQLQQQGVVGTAFHSVTSAIVAIQLKLVCIQQITAANQQVQRGAELVQLIEDSSSLAVQFNSKLEELATLVAGQGSEQVEERLRRELAQVALEEMECDLEGMAYEYHKAKDAVGSEAEGSKDRDKCRKKMEEVYGKAKRTVERYNQVAPFGDPPRQLLSVEMVIHDIDHPWLFMNLDENRLPGDYVTLKEKLKLCEARCWLERCEEQEGIVLAEMDKYMMYYERMITQLDEDIVAVSERPPRQPSTFSTAAPIMEWEESLAPGMKCALQEGRHFAEQQLGRGRLAFGHGTQGVYQQGSHYVGRN